KAIVSHSPPTDTLDKWPTTIKGKIRYRFPGMENEETYPAANVKVYLKKVYVKTTFDENNQPVYEPLTETEEENLFDYQSMLDGEMVETDEDGNFTLEVGMTTYDSAGVIPDDKWGDVLSLQYRNNHQFLGESGASDQGLNGLKGQLTCMYKVVVPNNHYVPTEEYIRVSPGATLDLRTLVMDANTYTLNVNVREY